ncbi:MAG: FAD/NAD(P)-binding protein [Firmicutes bacterium]|nr:FAD/NAD(P)-binding protein [Bacillota bacterium]
MISANQTSATIADSINEPEASPFVPLPYKIVNKHHDTQDIATITIEPVDKAIPPYKSGQFNMLTVYRVGEIAISISSPPTSGKRIVHTIRDVGAVSHALFNLEIGDVIGVRGAFGTDWQTDEPGDADYLVVAGGIGLAPLRGAVVELAEKVAARHNVNLLIGAREPAQMIYETDMKRLEQMGVKVYKTVDMADSGWKGSVGLVTELIEKAVFDPKNTKALICGPEVMIRFTARKLIEFGIAAESILVSLERNMQCGVGLCGHCQLGPYLICRDGPVFPWAPPVKDLLSQKER